MAPLDLTQLEELFEKNYNIPEVFDYWFEQLSEYEPEGSESPRTIKKIMKAMKWLMQYEHAHALDSKELAEKEAAKLVEQQGNWEEEKQNMKGEINSLRQKITFTAEAKDMNEAFRAQINSLQEENEYLKAQNRDRDRELAIQNDKVERLSSRIEKLEKERAALVQQHALSEDVIRELSRRLDSKLESLTKDSVEASKLRQRSQQAAHLSKELQEVVHQNDELRAEVEQLSSALTSATRFIEDTAKNYTTLREQLLESDKIIECLTNDNELLTKKLVDEVGCTDKESIQHYKELVYKKDEQIEALQRKFDILQVEMQEIQARSMLENNVEREEEMERLRIELVEATKVARQLFSSTMTNTVTDKSVLQMQRKILELNETVNSLQCQLKHHKFQNAEFIDIIQQKESENLKTNAELRRLRETIFGSAEIEISRLEKQLSFREQQIEKLTSKCSLLQAELGGSANAFNQQLAVIGSVVDDSPQETTSEPTTVKSELRSDETKMVPRECLKDDKEFTQGSEELSVGANVDPEEEKTQEKPKHLKEKWEYNHKNSLESWEASAIVIASVNHELMLLMQELNEKDQQLRRMEKSTKLAASRIDELKVKYVILQKEVSEYDNMQHNKMVEELHEKVQRYEIEIEEYQKLAETLRFSKNGTEQKLEEVNRQIIAERLRNLQLVRKLEIVEHDRNEQNEKFIKLERCYEEQRLLHIKQLKIANYESELAAVEIARLQTVLLHSTPKADYDELLAQHKKLLAFGDNQKPYHHTTDTTDKEYIAINLLKEMVGDAQCAELVVENRHLKNLNNVLTNQSEHWQAEMERIQAQNTEMKQFLEDVGSESHVKRLLVALERRFLKALSEKSQFIQNQTFASHQLLDLQNEFTQKKRSWAREKEKLIQVIRSSQRLLQVRRRRTEVISTGGFAQLLTFHRNLIMEKLRIRLNSMDLLTVQQMVHYKEKIAEIDENYKRSLKYKEEIEEEKKELDLQLQSAEALRRSYELLHENDYDVVKLQKTLQANHLNLMCTMKQLENAELQIQKKDAQIKIMEERVQNLQREIDDLYTASFKISNFDESSGKVYEQPPACVTEISNKQTGELLELAMCKPEISEQVKDNPKDIKADETLTEILYNELDDKLPAAPSSPQTITTAKNVLEEYEKKMDYIRETAEMCIENYKKQMKYKDEMIEKYKVLLQSTQDEYAGLKKSDAFSLLADDFEKRKLRTSNEILSHTYGADNEAKEVQILKLRNDIEHLTIANRRLSDKISDYHREIKDLTDANTQTDIADQDDRINDRFSNEQNTAHFAIDLPPTKKEFKGADVEMELTDILPMPTRSTKTIPSELSEVQDDALVETVRREGSITMIQRIEIRKLKQHIVILSAKNKKLEKACETIRAEALSQIEHSYALNSNDESETIKKLQKEIYALKKETENQKSLIREQKEIIGRLQDLEKTQVIENAQDEVARWHKKKMYEKNVNLLQKKLKELGERETELQQKLKKRDRRIEQLSRSEISRSAEVEQLQGIVKKLREDKEMCSVREVTEGRLKSLEEINGHPNYRTSQLKENDNNRNSNNCNYVTINGKSASKLGVTKIKATDIHILEELRPGEVEQPDDSMKRLARLEKETKVYLEEIRVLNNKLNERKSYDCGAVAVLRDKLIAKEKIIEQQQKQIEQLEREKWQNLL